MNRIRVAGNETPTYGHCACTEMRVRLKTAPFATAVEEAITSEEPGECSLYDRTVSFKRNNRVITSVNARSRSIIVQR
jgi:hypothetical protein